MIADCLAFVAEITRRETPILEVLCSKLIRNKRLLIRGLVVLFSFFLIIKLICRVLARVCKAHLRLCSIFKLI